MRTFGLSLFCMQACLAMLLLNGNNLQAASILVRLEQPPPSGTVAFALFDSANSFGDLRKPARLDIQPVDGRDVYQLDGVAPGEYALLVYHDENGNRRMDKNFIGIPTEPVGFSNGYSPKGPPNYTQAAFRLEEDEQRTFTVDLRRPLGKRGRLGVGPGLIARSSPYRDYHGNISKVIPAIAYNGERLQIFGPNFQFGLSGTGKLRLAAVGRYRIGVYEEDDSDYLEGMGDRDDTLMAGLALQAELPFGFDFALSYQHDMLDNIGGGEARAALDKSLQVGAFRISPEMGLNWLADDLASHDFGVPADKARSGRPAYDPEASFSFEVGLGLMYELTTDWLVIMNVAAEFFSDEITDSPIVDDDYVLKGFFAINYVF